MYVYVFVLNTKKQNMCAVFHDDREGKAEEDKKKNKDSYR